MDKFKQIIAVMMLVALFFVGCDKDKNNGPTGPEVGTVTDIDLNKIMNSSYSNLAPEQQKVKLEMESIDFLNELKAASSLKAIDIMKYFNDLMEMDTPDVDDPLTEGTSKNVEQTIFDIVNIYGIFEWNNSKKEWTKKASNSELRFDFPANNKATSNNASLSLRGSNSGASINYYYEDYYGDKNKYEDILKLPNTASGILYLDSKEIARIEIGVEYQPFDEIVIDEEYNESIKGSYPVKSKLLISTSEGYKYWYSVDGTGGNSRVEMQLSKGNKILIETLYAMDIDFKYVVDEASDDIDNIFDLSKANANGYMQLMEDIALIYQIDVAKLAKEMDKIESKYDDYYYYGYPKAYYDEWENALKQYMKVVLVSTKDNCKIADVTYKAMEDCYWDWDCDYYISPFLKFGDGSEIDAEVYFSEGFGELEDTWEDFVDAFSR